MRFLVLGKYSGDLSPLPRPTKGFPSVKFGERNRLSTQMNLDAVIIFLPNIINERECPKVYLLSLNSISSTRFSNLAERYPRLSGCLRNEIARYNFSLSMSAGRIFLPSEVVSAL